MFVVYHTLQLSREDLAIIGEAVQYKGEDGERFDPDDFPTDPEHFMA